MRTGARPIIGVELGARMENTALSVTERAYVPTGERFTAGYYDPDRKRERLEAREALAVEYRVRHLERRRPPVRYKGVAGRVAELVQAVGDCDVVLDITRTGRPVHTLIMGAVWEALAGTRTRIRRCPVTVTGAAGGVSHNPEGGWLVPRRDLVTAALLLFEQEQLKIAEGLELAGTLTEEFANFKPKPDPREDLEGWRLAKNDDLVLAVAMSVWAAERFLRKEGSRPAGGGVAGAA